MNHSQTLSNEINTEKENKKEFEVTLLLWPAETHRTRHMYAAVFRFSFTKMRQSVVTFVSHWSTVAMHLRFNAFICYSVVFLSSFSYYLLPLVCTKRREKNKRTAKYLLAFWMNSLVLMCWYLFVIIIIIIIISVCVWDFDNNSFTLLIVGRCFFDNFKSILPIIT